MKKLILIGVFILFNSYSLFAQEVTMAQAAIHRSQVAKVGVGIKSFDINKGEAVVKIKWDLDKLEYQLIYKKPPSLLEHYVKESFPRDNITRITFVDKDGFKIVERFCFVKSFSYDKDGQNLICRNSADDDRMFFSVEEYRKIEGAIVLINQNPAN